MCWVWWCVDIYRFMFAPVRNCRCVLCSYNVCAILLVRKSSKHAVFERLNKSPFVRSVVCASRVVAHRDHGAQHMVIIPTTTIISQNVVLFAKLVVAPLIARRLSIRVPFCATILSVSRAVWQHQKRDRNWTAAMFGPILISKVCRNKVR